MKFTITFKTPDAVYDAITQAVAVADDADEYVDVEKTKENKHNMQETCAKWFRYGEYVDIEIDTETGTATVLKV